MIYTIALGSATLWGAMVLLGLLDKRRAAAITAAFTAVLAITPFLPRFVYYVYSREDFIVRYGSAAIQEVQVGGVLVAFGLAALIASPFAAKRRWGWILPAVFSLPPVLVNVWMAFWFQIRF
jgi:hypothetical protein